MSLCVIPEGHLDSCISTEHYGYLCFGEHNQKLVPDKFFTSAKFTEVQEKAYIIRHMIAVVTCSILNVSQSKQRHFNFTKWNLLMSK